MLRRVIASASLLSILLPATAAFSAGLPVLRVQVLARPTQSVAIGAQRVPMLTLQLTTECPTGRAAMTQESVLRSIMLKHRGLGDRRDIERVYAYSDGMRRTRTAIVNDRGISTLYFGGYRLKKCSTVSLDILADISPDAAAAGEHGFEIVDAADIVTDPPMQVALNAAGDLGLTVPVGRVVGSIVSEALALPNTLNYGAARTVARLRLKATGRDDQAISSITFVNDGTARDSDLQNFVLETSGHSVLSSTVPALSGDRVTLILNPPLVIRRNEVRLVNLLADVRASRRKTVRLIIQEPSDIEVVPVK